MTPAELTAKLPDALKPWAATYGPAFIAMTGEEVKAWIEMLIRGDVMPAYKAVLAKLPNADALAGLDTLNAEWDAANSKNADRMELQRSAAVAALKVMLTIALALVGL